MQKFDSKPKGNNNFSDQAMRHNTSWQYNNTRLNQNRKKKKEREKKTHPKNFSASLRKCRTRNVNKQTKNTCHKSTCTSSQN